MIIGDLSNNLFFNTPVLLSNHTELQLKNTIFDEIKIDDALLPFVTEKELWGYNTVIYAKFNNSLNAGTFDVESNTKIKDIRIRKRKKDSYNWMSVTDIPYSTNRIYEFRDILVESNQDYEYSVQSVFEDGTISSDMVDEVECEFEGVWLQDKAESFQINFDTELSDITTNSTQNIVTTLGSQYPYIIKNGAINYREFTVKGTILSKSTISRNNSTLDIKEDKKAREKLTQYLNNGKPKLVKDDSGNYILSQIKDVTLTPRQELGRQLYGISFSVVEIGDAYDENVLISCGVKDVN